MPGRWFFMKRRIGSWNLWRISRRFLGPRQVTLARELTKIHEEFLMGDAAEIRDALAKRPSIKGEITLMIGKGETSAVDETPIEAASIN